MSMNNVWMVRSARDRLVAAGGNGGRRVAFDVSGDPVVDLPDAVVLAAAGFRCRHPVVTPSLVIRGTESCKH